MRERAKPVMDIAAFRRAAEKTKQKATRETTAAAEERRRPSGDRATVALLTTGLLAVVGMYARRRRKRADDGDKGTQPGMSFADRRRVWLSVPILLGGASVIVRHDLVGAALCVASLLSLWYF